jgi:predicted negative regulator of RcsB-dependent stress response
VKRIWLGVGVTLIVLAYFGGFWPQHQQLTASQTLAGTLQNQLAVAEARIRLGQILGQLLRLSDAVRTKNYGEAATLSSAYFDAVRAEASRTSAEGAAALNSILNSRDQVTTAIAGTDAQLEITLREHEQQLRRALGYPTGNPS